MNSTPKTVPLIATTAGLICLLVFLRTLFSDFVNLDDQIYVLNSEVIRRLDWNLVVWAFTHPAANWVPLTHISFALDYYFWGLNPFGYHLTNIVLHAANTVLVVLIADRLYRSRYAGVDAVLAMDWLYPAMLLLAGLLFGIHPLRVESVAWVTERKDVLNGLFAFGSILFYLRYAQKDNAARKNFFTDRDYVISLLLFLLSLSAKTMSATIPALLLVVDWYPLGRLRKLRDLTALVIEKSPYFILSMAVSIGMIRMSSHQGYLLTVGAFPFETRLIASGNALFEYCRLMLVPLGISPLHIIPNPVPDAYTVKTLLVVIFTGFVVYVGRRRKWLLATWLYFVISLVPILAMFQVNPMAFAAHCTYLPSVVPSIMVAALIAMVYKKAAECPQRYPRILVVVMSVALLVFYGAMTQLHINVWKDSGALWSRVIAIQPFDRAYFTRGLYYVDAGKYREAVDDYTVCLKIMNHDKNPDIFNLYAFRGEALAKAGSYEEAVNDFTAALAVYPHRLYYYHRGMALKKLGRMKEAEDDLKRAGKASGQMYWFNG